MPPYIRNTLLNFFSFFLIAFSLYIFISLVSYDATDSGFFNKNSNDVINTNLPVNNDNLFEQLIAQPESPPQQLLGMINANGLETIEYPVGSGITWQRFSPTQPWTRK